MTVRDSRFSPPSNSLRKLMSEPAELKGEIEVLRGQLATQKLSTVAPTELRSHARELAQIKSTLARVRPTVPDYWPTAFQVINLLSRATSTVKAMHPALDLTDVSGLTPQVVRYPPGSVIRLHGHVTNSVFAGQIVTLDASVILENVRFIDCTIVLPIIADPPVPLQQIGSQLLVTSNLGNVTLSAGRSIQNAGIYFRFRCTAETVP
jgi:ribosomal protein L29